jgi:hypothetical protein
MVLCATATEANAARENNSGNPSLQRAAAGPNSYPAAKDQYEGYGMINPDAAIEAVTLGYTVGAGASATLGSEVTERRVWARKISLAAGMTFQPSISVPAGADFDLYLYSGNPGGFGTPVLIASATTAVTGGTETFSHTPVATVDAILVVKRVSGAGTFIRRIAGAGQYRGGPLGICRKPDGHGHHVDVGRFRSGQCQPHQRFRLSLWGVRKR